MSNRLHVGITATRDGLTDGQLARLRLLFGELRTKAGSRGVAFHHGDCVGGDDQAAVLAREFRFHLVCHPPTVRQQRAYAPYDEIRRPLSYMARNDAIVWESGLIIGCPGTDVEQLRSGTWATIRRARKADKALIVVGLDGAILESQRVRFQENA